MMPSKRLSIFSGIFLLLFFSGKITGWSRDPQDVKGAIKLELDFRPQTDDAGKPLVVDGETIFNYIPAGHELDRHGHIEMRVDLVIRSVPAVPHRYFGRLLSLRDDVQIITDDRIITDGQGVFHATLRTRNERAGWQIRISRFRHPHFI